MNKTAAQSLPTIGLRAELPEKPTGWTRKMDLHLNFGERGGGATFSVFDESGNETEIRYQYDTTDGGLTGFTLPRVEEVMTWQELRARWPEWIKTRGR
jgi:hypothetical protein